MLATAIAEREEIDYSAFSFKYPFKGMFGDADTLTYQHAHTHVNLCLLGEWGATQLSS